MQLEVAIPALVPLPRVAPVERRVEPRLVPTARRRVAFALGSAGTLALGASLVIALDARHDHRAARSHCDPDLRCDPFGFTALSDARRRGTVATVVGAVGVGTLVTALIVYFSGPRERMIVPLTSPDAVGVTVQGDL